VPTSLTKPLALAAASALILSAYQRRHRLSTPEAEHLGLSVTETLATLGRARPAIMADVPTVSHKPVRRVKRRETPPEPEPDLDAEPEPPETEVSEPVDIVMVLAPPKGEDEPEDELEPAETGASVEGRAKRKRPSRPRSKRGNREGNGHV
jgi:hypothetical protein